MVWSAAMAALPLCARCLWITYLNSPQTIVPGTRNFFLSMSGRFDLGARVQTTGTRSGYFARMRRASELRFSNGSCSTAMELKIKMPCPAQQHYPEHHLRRLTSGAKMAT
mmetsp:Transcript_9915/g.27673  ORF Transcript_9915/g.27673 Transcript_9915/m.27673 type:complete len:110 (+) Transcript_9915:392-721(+)